MPGDLLGEQAKRRSPARAGRRRTKRGVGPECAATITTSHPAFCTGHEHLGLLDEAREAHLPLDVGLVPDGDAGVGQAEDADLDRSVRLAA